MITIMTPTYNRAKLLRRLYNSLKSQTNTGFEWLIVDDGSTDDTKSIVNEFISENAIRIRYIYQENQGKAVAFNNGVRNAKGDLFFCVDSDDFLPDDAVKKILICSKYLQNEVVAGIAALKCDVSSNMLCDYFPNELKYEDTFRLSEFHKCRGEWSLIYKTTILKNFLFPEIENEKFITECVVYDKIAQKYTMFLLNEVLTICEYQQDGLTNNIVGNMLKNPTGYKFFYSQRIDMAYSLGKRLGYIIRYNVFKHLSPDKNYNYTGKYKLLADIFGLVGIIGKMYYSTRAQ